MNRPTLTKKIYNALIKDLPEDANTNEYLLLASRITKVFLPTQRPINKSEYEECHLPFDHRPLYAQISDGADWTGICRGREYFGDDITDPNDGITKDITTHLALRSCGLFLETNNHA